MKEQKKKVPDLRFKGFTDDWEQRKLKELTKSLFQGINTAADNVEYSNDGLPIIQAKNITSGILDFSGSRKLSVQRYSNYLDKYIPQKGDILFANIGTIGPNVILKDTHQFFIAWNVLRIVPKNDVNGEFLKITLDLLNSKHYFEKLLTGNATKFINKNDMKNLPIFLSNPEEQKKICRVLLTIDNIVALQQRKLALLKQLKKGLLQKMFADKGSKRPILRFEGFTGNWEQRKFSEILAKSDGLRRGPFGSALKKEFFISSSEYTVYEQNNAIYNTWKTRYFITPEKFQELHKFQLMPGDFILSGAGTIGRIAQVPANITKGVFNQALIRIRINPEWMDKKFFLIWMQSENMQRKLTQANPGSAMTNLVPMSEIKKWEIIIPSKAEQNKIGEFIQKLNSFITLHQRKQNHLKLLKKSLLQQMFM